MKSEYTDTIIKSIFGISRDELEAREDKASMTAVGLSYTIDSAVREYERALVALEGRVSNERVYLAGNMHLSAHWLITHANRAGQEQERITKAIETLRTIRQLWNE